MFEGHPLAVTAQPEASQVELTVLHATGPSSISSTVPVASIQPTGQLAALAQLLINGTRHY
jgi:hypothetical protein